MLVPQSSPSRKTCGRRQWTPPYPAAPAAEPPVVAPPAEPVEVGFVEVHPRRPKSTLRVAAKGEWRHEPSGVVFPERFGDLQRTGISQYDMDGDDVSAGYSSLDRGWPLVMTIFVYPGPRMTAVDAPASAVAAAREAFARSIVDREAEIVRQYHERKGEACLETGRAAVTVPAPDGEHAGTLVSFDMSPPAGAPGDPKASLLYLFPWSARDWNVKVRVTHPRGESVASEIEGLLGAWVWPSKTR